MVHPSPPQFRLADDLPEFFIEGLATAAPVDLGVGLGKEQGHKRLEVQIEGVFPGTVVVTHESPQKTLVHGLRGHGAAAAPAAGPLARGL